jgi:hypothetical protein
MKRFLFGAITMAALLALTSFVVTQQRAAPEVTKVVRHEGTLTYVWEMNGSDVAAVTVYGLETGPHGRYSGLEKSHYQLKVESK